MRDDLPAGSKECPKCGAPIWRDCETSPDEIGEDRVTVTFESEGRNGHATQMSKSGTHRDAGKSQKAGHNRRRPI